MTWICDVPPNRATIWFAHTNNAWRGCIERPHQYKQDKWFLPSFDAALTWAEDELRAADATVLPPPPTPLSLATLTPAHRQRLMPYWIDPQALEPAQLTYQAVLLLTHVPIRQKGSELSFGERSYHPHDYPTVRELTKRLNLAMQAVDVRVQPGSIYAVTSLTTYMQMQTATEQAQQLWNTVAATLRSGTITGAVYGVKEIQTQFCAWIGGYGIWPVAASDRAQEMAARAFDLTLIYALDVDGYRATEPKLFTGLNDDELLEYLHVQRTRSAYIPVVARTESEQWLRDQGHPDLIDYVDPLSRKAQHRSKEHNRKYQALVAESREWLSQHAPKQTRTH